MRPFYTKQGYLQEEVSPFLNIITSSYKWSLTVLNALGWMHTLMSSGARWFIILKHFIFPIRYSTHMLFFSSKWVNSVADGGWGVIIAFVSAGNNTIMTFHWCRMKSTSGIQGCFLLHSCHLYCSQCSPHSFQNLICKLIISGFAQYLKTNVRL